MHPFFKGKFVLGTEIYDSFNISVKFQERLADLIIDIDCKKSMLHEKIGVSQCILIKALNVGLLPSTRILMRIADYFGVSIDYLIGLTDKESFFKPDNKVDFSHRICELIKLKNTTEFNISQKIGFPRSLFTKWKQKKYIPSLEIAVLLAQYLNVSLDYLLGRTDERLD